MLAEIHGASCPFSRKISSNWATSSPPRLHFIAELCSRHHPLPVGQRRRRREFSTASECLLTITNEPIFRSICTWVVMFAATVMQVKTKLFLLEMITMKLRRNRRTAEMMDLPWKRCNKRHKRCSWIYRYNYSRQKELQITGKVLRLAF